MARFLPLLVALFLGHAIAADLPKACAAGCVSSMLGDYAALKCNNGDQLCVCNSGDMSNGVRDCITQACSSTYTPDELKTEIDAAQASAKSQCDQIKGAAAATPAPPQSPAPATTTPAAPPSTLTSSRSDSAPATSLSSSPIAQVSTTSTSSTASAKSTASIPNQLGTSTSSSTVSLTAPTSTSSGTSKTSSTIYDGAVSSTGNTSPTTTASATSSSSSGLTAAAKAGIGAGAGVALILSLVIVGCLISRKRKPKPQAGGGQPSIPSMEISRPLPGSGRQYAYDTEAAQVPALSTHFRADQPPPIRPTQYTPSLISSQYSPKSAYTPSRPSRDDDYGIQSRRYEDMIPRTQPRTMI